MTAPRRPDAPKVGVPIDKISVLWQLVSGLLIAIVSTVMIYATIRSDIKQTQQDVQSIKEQLREVNTTQKTQGTETREALDRQNEKISTTQNSLLELKGTVGVLSERMDDMRQKTSDKTR